MWPFTKYIVSYKVDKEQLYLEIKPTLEHLIYKCINDFYRDIFLLNATHITIGGHTFEERVKNSINNGINTFIKEKFEQLEENIIRSKVERYLASEEFIDKIVERILKKQLRNN